MRAVSIASSMPSPAGDEASASKAFDTSGQPPQTDESGMSRRVSPYRVDRAFDLELLESRRLLSADGSSAGAGLTATYYDQIDFSGHSVTRVDPTINFNWGSAGPAPGISGDTFSVRWTGTLTPRYSETYTFHTTTDDGVRLWVDGKLIIDHWRDQRATEHRGSIPLQAGKPVDIRMEYYEHRGGATAKLMWSSNRQKKEIVPTEALVALTTTEQSSAVSTMPVASITKNSYVWLEINQVKPVAEFLPHAPAWKQIGQLIITSTHYNAADVFDRISQAGHRFIPGLKTSTLLRNIEDPGQWKQLAQYVRDLARRTGSTTFVLEHESAFRDMLLAEEDPDFDAIRAAIRDAGWPADVEIWWHPSVYGQGKVLERTTFLARCAKESIPQCRTTDTVTVAGPRSMTDAWAINAASILRDVDPQAIQMAYLGGGHWTQKTVERAFSEARGDLILFPGWSSLGTATELREILEGTLDQYQR